MSEFVEMSRDEQRVLESFDYHKPSDEQIERIATIRRTMRHSAELAMLNVASCADRSAGLRLLHEAMMTFNKAIVCEGDRRRP